MNHTFARTAAASLFLAGAAALASGCTATASAGVSPPPPGGTCDIDSTVVCDAGTGFSCTGGDAPEDSDSSLLCSEGVAGNAGSVIYCCLHASSDTTCGDDPTVACPGGGFGFSCRDATEPPNVAYPTLRCSAPVQGNAGSATYCCTDS